MPAVDRETIDENIIEFLLTYIQYGKCVLVSFFKCYYDM